MVDNQELNTLNEVKYKDDFCNLINSLDKNKIYKLIFLWQTITYTDMGDKNIEFNTSSSFFVKEWINDSDFVAFGDIVAKLKVIEKKY